MLLLPILATLTATATAVNNQKREFTTIQPAKQHHEHKHAARDVVGTVVEYYDQAGNIVSTAFIAASETTSSSETTSVSVSAVQENAVSVATTTDASSTTASSSTSSSSTSSSTSTSSSSSSSSSSDISGNLDNFESPSTTFTDGTIKCTDIDSLTEQDGVIALDWVGYGGYASVMNMDGDTSTTCKSGYYCSYACQAGMSKTQWPSTQPSDGRTVGGLYCDSDGYLYKTNTDKDYLCEWGEESAYFKSEIDEEVALCRTDYPGSENMVVPTLLSSDSTEPVSVVIEDSYFKWDGASTSAQYYVNNAGVSVEDGCIWSTSGTTVGNWAPLVIGAGYSDSISYLSLIPNPNNEAGTNYNVKFVARDGASMNGDCAYVDDTYTGGSGSDGCTISVTSGIVDIVFY